MSCLWSTESVIVMLTRQSVYIKPNTEAHNHYCSGKATGISSVALFTQHAKPRVLLYCHLSSDRLYRIFPHYFINGAIFGKKGYWIKMCVSIFCTFFVSNISHSKKKWAWYYHKCVFRCSCAVPVIRVWFVWNLTFLGGFSKHTQI